ncbi:HET-domain-containing protein [Cladorrhinum sp. PSN332]|nr:HET-domain-containing protein [Cladorrhinum sp. PSN332]
MDTRKRVETMRAERKARRSEKTSRVSLSSQINANLSKSVFDDQIKDFLPDGVLDSLVAEDAVRQELAMAGDGAEDGLVDFVLKRARKLFVITLLAGLTSARQGSEDYGQLATAMMDFQYDDIDDSCLPILFDNSRTQRPFYDDENELMEPWDPVKLRNFSRYQWTVLVPVLSRENPALELHADCILPVVGKAQGVESGAFGEVCRVTIHERHHLDPIIKFDGTRAAVAIKVIKQVYGDTKDAAKLKELKEEWEREVQAHIAFRDLRHPNIIEFIAAMERGADRYLLFRWADEGTLKGFWESNKRPSVNAELVRDVVYQIKGLTDALDNLHNYRHGGESYRHVNLKPENILCVLERKPEEGKANVPVLKISDMGLAKHHTVANELRKKASVQYTTTRYEPPEVALEANSHFGRSRRYDMWSLGCVMLEMIIWLLYGNGSLETFNSKIVDEFKEGSHWFEIKNNPDASRTARVHPHVEATMKALETDAECLGDTVIRRILDIVKTRLLVVDLKTATPVSAHEGPKSEAGPRWHSQELLGSLNELIERANNNPTYWFTGQDRSHLKNLHVSSLEPTYLLPANQQRPPTWVPENSTQLEAGLDAISSIVPTPQEIRTRRLDITEFPVDNNFAEELGQAMQNNEQDIFKHANAPAQPQLCGDCRKFNICEPKFYILDILDELEVKQNSCDFCRLRWEACQNLDAGVRTARFDREQSIFRLNEGRVPGLSICRTPDLNLPNTPMIQIGLPRLPAIKSSAYFSILARWLNDCDKNHQHCQSASGSTRPPTRLLDVGTTDSPVIHLFETSSRREKSYQYVALSHPWGQGPHFCTLPSNIDRHKQGIPIAGPDFPNTFRDAVIATRALNRRYLWIDSICIIQGKEGDFLQESERMGDVFGSAYCVLAASSAHRQQDGFLNTKRPDRRYIQLPENESKGLYVCEFIDDFDEHVLNSPLSKRGWVMQERALARRTIYFTDRQTYFECGGGVRCETLTKAENKLTSFLGDANFPSRLSSQLSDRGERIRFYEDLYRQYSRLRFTDMRDRPVAIAGLEERMLRDLQAQGGRYGVFDDGHSLLLRSLLWRRGAEQTELKIVDFSPREGETNKVEEPPSWSWMRYEGSIDYLDLPLGGVDWIEGVVTGPWDGDSRQGEVGKGLVASARRFTQPPVWDSMGDVEIVLDAGGDQYARAGRDWNSWTCVVVGTRRILRGAAYVLTPQRRHYVLIIAPQDGVYKRIGVGYLPGRFIGDHLDKQIIIE